ncbi:cilia- and flagella-associated protein 97-like [Ptychodera flava]|uniref:cilia- and flagella-associated protein 97-like n=1 Tax=Ptychodera flava TaxID=63121 RepID=UPI003969F232
MSDDLDEPIDHDFFDMDNDRSRDKSARRDDSPERYRSSQDKHRSDGKQNGAGGEWSSLVLSSARSTSSTGSKREIQAKIPTGTPREDDYIYSSDEDHVDAKESENDHKNRENKQKHASKRSDSPDDTERSKPRRNLKSAGPRRDGGLSPRPDKRSKDPSPKRDKDKKGESKHKKRYDSPGSESDSDYSYSSYSSSEYSSYTDSESEITDVSPLSSPQGSPRRQRRVKKISSDPELSPRSGDRESPKRVTVGGKPPTRPVSAKRSPRHKDIVQYPGVTPNGQRDMLLHSTDGRDLSLLLRAVLELDETSKQTLRRGISESSAKKVLFKQPRTNPQHRKNLSFSNDRVKQIDSENQRLLRNILQNTKPRPKKKRVERQQPMVLSHAALNRAREQRRIERENFEMLKRIEAQRATSYLQRDALLREHDRKLTYGLQVTHSPGERPMSGKKPRPATKVYTQTMGSRTSSLSSLQSHGSRPGSGRPTSAKKPPQKAKPAWDDRW